MQIKSITVEIGRNDDTPNSFDVREVSISYIDEDGNINSITTNIPVAEGVVYQGVPANILARVSKRLFGLGGLGDVE